jgi:carbon monoxide dehydrogenase subunit G
LGRYRSIAHVAAPPDRVFDLWTDLDRFKEWIGGVTGVTDVSGPLDEAGTRYTVLFGGMQSPTEVLEVERPHLIRTRFGNRVLKGETVATFAPDGAGTLLTQELRTEGLISAVMARIFATGSWRGSFQGELNTFAALAERDAATPTPGRPTS